MGMSTMAARVKKCTLLQFVPMGSWICGYWSGRFDLLIELVIKNSSPRELIRVLKYYLKEGFCVCS